METLEISHTPEILKLPFGNYELGAYLFDPKVIVV
jgi:hypothetical protein